MAQPVTTIGELVVIALKAENLPNRVATGRQDPFCIFKLGGTAKKTKTDPNGGKNPIWDDQINLPVPQGITRLFVQVFHRQASKENLISEGHVDLHQVLRQGEHDGFFPLVMNGTKAGQIYLELTFYAGPVHRQPQPSRHYRPPPPMNRPPMPQPRPYAPPIRPMMNHAHTSARPLPPTPSYRPPSTTPPVRYSNPPPASFRPPNQTSLPANPPPAGFRPLNQTSLPANPPPAGFRPPLPANTNPPPAGFRPPNQIPLPANGYPPRPSPSSFHGYHPPRPWPPQQQPYPPYPRPPAPF